MKRPHHARFVSCACLGVALLLAAGCTSSRAAASSTAGGEKTGRPQRVRLVDYVSGVNLELVNESHSSRTETYSATKKLEEATRKVTTDEVLDEVVNQYRTGGYFEHAAPGSAPREAAPGIGKAIEVEDGGRTVTWLIAKTAPKEERELFSRCAILFGTVYNNTYQLQSVDRAPDWQPSPPPAKKKGS